MLFKEKQGLSNYVSFPLRKIKFKTIVNMKGCINTSEQRSTKSTTVNKMFREHNSNKRPTRIKVMEVFDFPKHFILRNEVLSDPEEYVNLETEEKVKNSKPRVKSGRKKKRHQEHQTDYLDLDFMMPTQVREILLEEGLSKDVVDSTLGVDEKRHRKIMQLTLLAEK